LALGYGYQDSRETKDRRDLPKPGFLTKPLDISLLADWDRGRRYLADFRGDLGTGQSWKFRVINSTGDSSRITFSGLEKTGKGTQSVLLDMSRSHIWQVSASQPGVAVLTRKGAADEFELLIGNADYVEERVEEFQRLSRVFYLHQNFPNPFAHRTTIRYSIPVSEQSRSGYMRVRLEVFDLQGRKVITLVNGSRAMGELHSASWDGLGADGAPVPAGAYILRLRAGEEFEAKRKVLLLR
ncbi:T9SS type A sorting domain-containing protein, partial [Fibrobacterota bacterium]